MFEIIPSPGTTDKDFAGIEKKIQSVLPFVKTIHIDVIDGKFANNTTFSDPEPFAKYTKAPPGETGIIFEVHLMVHEPVNYLKKWADAGFSRFIGQVEKMSNQAEFIAEAELLGDAGLAIDLSTGVNAIKVPLDDLDAILVMGVRAGFSGQTFNEDAMVKVRELRERTEIPIEMDGGINDKTIHMASMVGANRFVATSFLFDSEKSPKEQFHLLEEKLIIAKG